MAAPQAAEQERIRTVRFGKHTYRIAFSQWDANKRIGFVQIYDEDGNPFIVQSQGLAPSEQRQAVASWAMHREVALSNAAKGVKPLPSEFGTQECDA